MLAEMVEENQRNWDRILQKAVFAYRVSINESTGFTPSWLISVDPQLPIDVMQLSKETPTNVPEFVQEVCKSIRVACDEKSEVTRSGGKPFYHTSSLISL